MRILSLLIFTLAIQTGIMAQSSVSDLQNYYKSVLNELSIKSEVDDEGDLAFNIQDRSFYLALDEKDSTYLQLTRWDIWKVTNVTEAIDVMTLVNEINRQQKVIKMFLVDDMVMISAELFTDGQRKDQQLIKRGIEAIMTAENIFLSRIL